MKFGKPPLTYEAQADLAISRGLEADKGELIERLRAVSYYRLCAYWHPFKRPDDSFKPGTTLEDAWQRYIFDRQLRLLVMDAIERVEITIRSNVAYELSHKFGPFAHIDINNFPGMAPTEHLRLLDDLHENANRSREAFAEHFRKTYDEFPDLPLWAAVETMTFGQMFTIYKNCDKRIQQQIAMKFGIAGKVLFSWLLTLNYIRNLCAHHSRLWNRELAIKPLIPHHDKRWHQPIEIQNDRVFAVVTLLRHLLSQTAQQSQWRERLYSLFDRYAEVPLVSMGIPTEWRKLPLWE